MNNTNLDKTWNWALEKVKFKSSSNITGFPGLILNQNLEAEKFCRNAEVVRKHLNKALPLYHSSIEQSWNKISLQLESKSENNWVFLKIFRYVTVVLMVLVALTFISHNLELFQIEPAIGKSLLSEQTSGNKFIQNSRLIFFFPSDVRIANMNYLNSTQKTVKSFESKKLINTSFKLITKT